MGKRYITKTTVAKITFLAMVVAAASSSPSHAKSKEGYHFSQVRAHQFVEAWPSLNADGKAIHIRVKVSNGVQMAPFNPIVWIDFVDAAGGVIARFAHSYILGPSGWGHGVDRTFDYDIPRPELWSMSDSVEVRAFETPPRGSSQTLPIYRLDDPLKCLGTCGPS